MARVRHRWPVSRTPQPIASLLHRPRTDLLTEQREPDGSFTQASGPFTRYRRTVEESSEELVETTEYELSIPWWGWLLAWPVRHSIRGTSRARPPWWAPPEPLDRRAVSVLGLLAATAIAVGYLNTLFTQTVAFAADEFGASAGAQGVAGTIVRFGIVLSIGFLVLADRVGRRRMLVVASLVSPLLCALGAVAPTFAWLTVTQTLGRPIAIAMGLLVGIIAVEEMPPGSRAYAVSLLALASGLGAGFAVMALPLADLGVGGWRLVYLLAAVFAGLSVSLRRQLPESRRFEAPHPASPRMPRRRLALLAATGFLLNLLIAPASFFQNRYLKDVRGYSATLIALFTLVTNTPGGVGVVAGGRLADIHGRRIVGAVAVLGGAVGTVITFAVAGVPLWLASAGAAVIGGASVPALGVYAAELFPTGRRGLANGIIATLSLVGSSVGLLVAGSLLDGGATYAAVMAMLAIGPLIVTVLVLVAYPETAHLELEQINPEDRAVPVVSPPGVPPSAPAAQEGGHR